MKNVWSHFHREATDMGKPNQPLFFLFLLFNNDNKLIYLAPFKTEFTKWESQEDNIQNRHSTVKPKHKEASFKVSQNQRAKQIM